MKKITLLTVLLALTVLASHAPAAVRVVTTTEDLASIAREVGGDRVQVESIAHGTEDPHWIPPKPSYMVKLRKADLFVQVGLQLEVGWVPRLLEGARNGKIQRGGRGHVDASVGVRALEIPAVATRAEGDVHPYGNPHYWLDPLNGPIIARNIVDGLKRVDPEGAARYESNLEDFNARIHAGLKEWKGLLDPHGGTAVISYHRLWPYFEQRFGIRFVDQLEPKPGIPPSPKHLAALTERMEAEEIRVLVYGPYYNAKPVKELAKRTGATALQVPTGVGGAPGVETYFDLFDHLVGELSGALENSR